MAAEAAGVEAAQEQKGIKGRTEDLKGSELTPDLKTLLSKVKQVLDNHYEDRASFKGAPKPNPKAN